MLHLDEGILSALLDGEISGAEQQEIEAHLGGCAECRARLAELKGFMRAADQLVTALDEVPVQAAPSQPVRRRDYRALAWAASIVLAVGLGFAGRSLIQQRTALSSPDRVGDMSQKDVPVSDAPASATVASPEATGGAVALGTEPPAESPRSNERRDAAPPASRQVARDAEQRPGFADSNEAGLMAADSVGLRRQVASNLAEPQSRGVNEGAAGVGAPAQSGIVSLDSSARLEGQSLSRLSELDATALKSSAAREAASPPQAARAMLQPRDEVRGVGPLNQVGTRIIPMEEAVRVLGGTIRLVDSLTPVRVELWDADSTVRVIYETTGVEIWLDQRRSQGVAGDMLERAMAPGRKLASGSNQLSWNDLQGFYLTLTGPLPTAVLEQVRARIR